MPAETVTDSIVRLSARLAQQDKKISDLKGLAVSLERSARAARQGRQPPSARQAVIRALACHILSAAQRRSDERGTTSDPAKTPAAIAEVLFAGNKSVLDALANPAAFLTSRATTSPATSTTAGWAAQLSQSYNFGLFETLAPESAYATLARRGLRVPFHRFGSVRVVGRNAGTALAAAFVGEAEPIPVGQAGLTSLELDQKKAAAISFYTEEIAMRSVPVIEDIVGLIAAEDTGRLLDTLLFDGAAGTATRPASLLSGVAPLTPATGGGAAAVIADTATLLGAIAPSLDPVLIMSSANVAKMLGWCAGYAALSVIATDTLPVGKVVAVDAAALAVAEGDQPRIAASKEAVLVARDDPGPVGVPPNVVGAPAVSLWQQDMVALKVTHAVTWGLRAPGAVAWMTGAAW